MESEIKESNSFKNEANYPKEDLDYAYKFAAEISREVGRFVKSVILFGSKSRKKDKPHDIDVLVILDDVSIHLSKEFIQTYKIIVDNLVIKICRKLHITTFKYTSFWEYARHGDPIVVNVLRDGVPIVDREFFRPLQILLKQGRIIPSSEAMWTYYYKSSRSLQASKMKMLDAVTDLYWSVIDVSHAALMKIHETPPSPSHVSKLVESMLVDSGFIEQKYAKTAQKFYELSKKIEYRELEHIDGKTYDKYYKEASAYVARLRKFIETHDVHNK